LIPPHKQGWLSKLIKLVDDFSDGFVKKCHELDVLFTVDWQQDKVTSAKMASCQWLSSMFINDGNQHHTFKFLSKFTQGIPSHGWVVALVMSTW